MTIMMFDRPFSFSGLESFKSSIKILNYSKSLLTMIKVKWLIYQIKKSFIKC